MYLSFFFTIFFFLHFLKKLKIDCEDCVPKHTCSVCKDEIGDEDLIQLGEDCDFHVSCFFCSNCKLELNENNFIFSHSRLLCKNCPNTPPQQTNPPNHSSSTLSQNPSQFDLSHQPTTLSNDNPQSTTLSNDSPNSSDDNPLPTNISEKEKVEDSFLCFVCKKEIEEESISALERDYHEECFNCEMCSTNLCDSKFFVNQNKILCSNCNSNSISISPQDTQPKKQPEQKQEVEEEICHKCSQIIKGDIEEVNDLLFHPECFICSSCETPLGDDLFVKNNNIFCKNCK